MSRHREPPDIRIVFTLMGAGIVWGVTQLGFIAHSKQRRRKPTPNPA